MNENRGSRRGQNRHPPGNTGGPYRKKLLFHLFLGVEIWLFKESIILYIIIIKLI